MEELRLVVTRDRGGVLLWRGEPKFCIADLTYMNGGPAMILPVDAFPDMPMPGRRAVRLVAAEE